MRILIFNWKDLAHPRAGGAEVFVTEVAKQWLLQGHQVTLFCSRVDERPGQEVVDGLTIIRRGGRFGVYREARIFYEKEGRGRFDLVVDSVNTRPFLTPRFVENAPVVAAIYQLCADIWDLEFPSPIAALGRKFLEPRWLRNYRDVEVITISESTKQDLEAVGLNRVRIVPIGVSVPEFLPSHPKEESPTLLFVGRLAANKRPDHAIETFKLSRQHIPNLRLWVVGDGPMRHQLESDAPPGVSFFGRVSEEEKFALMSRAHVVLVTSVREGWGLVVTEAALVGTPSFAYDVAGLRDSVSASGAGLVVDADPKALARAVKDAFGNGLLRYKFVPQATAPAWAETAGAMLSGLPLSSAS